MEAVGAVATASTWMHAAVGTTGGTHHRHSMGCWGEREQRDSTSRHPRHKGGDEGAH